MDLTKVLELSELLDMDGFPRKSLDGNCMEIKEQCLDFSKIVLDYQIKSILEIGFNTGHSSLIFLQSSTETHVTSFEISI